MVYSELSDDILVEGCLRNDRKMQELLYRKYANEMYAICRTYESNTDAAKDILQEAFIKVFKNIASYDGSGSLKGWIRRIITNCAIDYYRRSPKKSNFVDIESIASKCLDNEVIESIYSADILKQVQRLPEGARLIFNLFALEGFTHKEIATKLNISEGTSKSQYSRARQLLQVWLDKN